jgi:hypothetical protein
MMPRLSLSPHCAPTLRKRRVSEQSSSPLTPSCTVRTRELPEPWNLGCVPAAATLEVQYLSLSEHRDSLRRLHVWSDAVDELTACKLVARRPARGAMCELASTSSCKLSRGARDGMS